MANQYLILKMGKLQSKATIKMEEEMERENTYHSIRCKKESLKIMRYGME